MINSVDAKTLKTWFDNNEAVLIDVREPEEYQAENIPDATLIPLASISTRVLPAFGNKKLVVHCKLGKRGLKACEKLLAENPSLDIYNLEGGIAAWSQAGNPVKKG